MARMAAVAWISLLLCGAACTSLPQSTLDPDRLRRHVLMFDHDGFPMDPAGDYLGWPTERRRMTAAEFKRYVERMLTPLATTEERVSGTPSAGSRATPVTLTLFIHGGITSHEDTIERATDEILKQAEEEGRHLIFISWHSSPLSNYRESFWSSQSKSPTAPFADTVSGLLDLLTDWYTEIDRFDGEDEGLDGIDHALSLANAARPNGDNKPENHHFPDVVPLQPNYDPESVGGFWRDTFWWLFTPARWLTTAVLHGYGRGAWQSMLRRARVLFDQDRFLGDPDPDEVVPGGLLYFLKRTKELQLADVTKWEEERSLRSLMKGLERTASSVDEPPRLDEEFVIEDAAPEDDETRPAPRFSVDVVAHSMGAIIVNGVLNYWLQHSLASDSRAGTPPDIENLLYLGAACSLRDYQNAVFPFLQVLAPKNDRVSGPRMTHVVLHPTDELRQDFAFDFVTRGSLLVWVDDYFAEPRGPLERTAGRFDNLMEELPMTPNDLADRIRVVALPGGSAGDDKSPHRHEELDNGRFWRFLEIAWPASDPAAKKP